MENKTILGITAFNHDSSACIIHNGKVLAFAEEERFNGVKHTNVFPAQAIEFCISKAGITKNDITDIAYYFNPMECVLAYLKHNNPFYFFVDPTIFFRGRFYYEIVWLTDFINRVRTIRKNINKNAKVHYINHHKAHAWYGYYASNFDNCIVLSNDSVGESISTLAEKFVNKDSTIYTETLIKQHDPHSLGYLYGAITEYLGYKRGEGEGRIMALASFGEPKYLDHFLSEVKFLDNGGFSFTKNLMLNRNFQIGGHRLGKKIRDLIGAPRKRNDEITKKHKDISRALQETYEEISIHQLNYVTKISDKIVLTGGVAQNSVFNGKATDKFPNIEFFVPPITNDAGCSLGAAVYLNYKLTGKLPERVDTAFLGPDYSDKDIISALENNKIQYELLNNAVDFCTEILSQNKVIGFFRGRMECGPRALCNRSIIANPMTNKTRDYLNINVKYRESFRPYGGFVLENKVKNVLEIKSNFTKGPYMTYVYPVKESWKEKIPSLVHIDGTCRIQIIDPTKDEFLTKLLESFERKTKVPVLINTSMNLRGYPIARTPNDAISTFYTSGMDYLLFNNHILIKK